MNHRLQLKKPRPRTGRVLNSPEEKERILQQYAGIFKNNIKEFGEKVLPRLKPIKNLSR